MNKNADLAFALGVLASQGWFSQRSNATRARLGAIAKLRRFAQNESIYLADDAPNGIFGLVSGSLNISVPRADGEGYTLHRAGAGLWIGDVALFSGGTSLVSVHAAEPTVMVQFPNQALMRLVQEDPRLYADFYALAYENFQTALRIISSLAIASSEKRLADRLILELDTRRDPEGWIHLTQPELAKMTAVSLPTLQRVMRLFVRAEILMGSYGRIRVVDRNSLARLCGGPHSNRQAMVKPKSSRSTLQHS
jgi:CRP-like cAMP-binding protein